jgi:NAD(P)-dependent dehydrogenase (short-subunit alcohol dehydrogenase family)
MIESSPAQRVGTPDDIAGLAEFLTGPASTFLTGNDILVDGGVVVSQRWSAGGATELTIGGVDHG